MKFILILIALVISIPAFCMNPKLEPAIKIVESCLSEQGVLLCKDDINEILKSVSLDARGEFVYYLKDKVFKNGTEQIIYNLYEKLQVLIPIYEKLDTCNVWSCRDLKIFFGDVSMSYVKFAPVTSALYISLYKSQPVQSGRYGLISTISEKSNSLSSLAEMDEMVKFAEFAKDYSKVLKDEYYLYQACVSIIKKMTIASIKLRPGHEGIYSIVFDDIEASKELGIDSVVVMESNDRDALVISLVARDSRLVKISFKQSGLLGDTFFSNEDVYNNNQEIQLPYFKMKLDRTNNTVQGLFSTSRFGKLTFKGKLNKSNLSVFDQKNITGFNLSDLVGRYKVKVGNYEMTLVFSKRADERGVYEGALLNDNALISFSKVTLDSLKGIISLVDTNNERKLTLGVINNSNSPIFKGQFLVINQAKILDVDSF